MKKFLKILGLILGSILLLIGLLLGYIVIEDRKYEPFEATNYVNTEPPRALLVTWNVPAEINFWEPYQKYLGPLFSELHDRGNIIRVIPMQHPPLKHPDHPETWTHCALISLGPAQSPEALTDQILNIITASPLASRLFAIDLLRTQPGLEMAYPVSDGLARESAMKQIIEYVFSDPAHREKYYEDQYKWSGPAMGELHHRDKVGRFLGYEVEARLVGDSELPAWDLLHLIGFTPWQMVKSKPYFYGVWNDHASRVFGEGMDFGKKLEEWNKLRLNIKSSAQQNIEATLQTDM